MGRSRPRLDIEGFEGSVHIPVGCKVEEGLGLEAGMGRSSRMESSRKEEHLQQDAVCGSHSHLGRSATVKLRSHPRPVS